MGRGEIKDGWSLRRGGLGPTSGPVGGCGGGGGGGGGTAPSTVAWLPLVKVAVLVKALYTMNAYEDMPANPDRPSQCCDTIYSVNW